MSLSSKSIIINNQNAAFANVICAVLMAGTIMLFCYGCTGKVGKMAPIDAVRNGQTGERFRKKSIMSLGRSKLPVSHDENENNIPIYQGTGTTTDMYGYTGGTPPQSAGEVALTRLSANNIIFRKNALFW